MLFMCWTRETGVIPAALAGLLLGMKAPGAPVIASVTFIAILMTILIQAPTTKWLGAAGTDGREGDAHCKSRVRRFVSFDGRTSRCYCCIAKRALGSFSNGCRRQA